jgi:hypothetical protein
MTQKSALFISSTLPPPPQSFLTKYFLLLTTALLLTFSFASCGGGGGSGAAPAEPAGASAIYFSKDGDGNTYALSFPTAARAAVNGPKLNSVFELKYNGNPTKGGTVTAVVGNLFTLTFSGTSTTLSVTINGVLLKDIVGTIIGKDGNTLVEITTKKTLTSTGNPDIKSVSGTYRYADAMLTSTITFNNPNFTITGNALGITITVKGTYTISEGIITCTIKTVQDPTGLSSKPGDTETLYILSNTQICDGDMILTKQ